MSINTREELNYYYELVNKLVDEYISDWNIMPSKLKKYLKPGTKGFQNFLDRNNLSDIKNIKSILIDVIDDRVYMEKDGILKFESFNKYESFRKKM